MQAQAAGPCRHCAAAARFASGRPSPRSRRRHAAPVEAAAGCRLAGVGSSVPATILTNKDLEQLVETNDEWIASRTGIRRAAVPNAAPAEHRQTRRLTSQPGRVRDG